MIRLFVALTIPDDVGARLCALAPPHGGGVRVVTLDLLHVTVHFLGAADEEAVVAALSEVRASAFRLTIGGGGKFSTKDDQTALWVGVQRCEGLVALHEALGAALTTATWRPEERPYTPHVTLARCKKHVPGDVIEGFLDGAAGFSEAIDVRDFSLYVSEPGPSGPLYSARRRFGLGA